MLDDVHRVSLSGQPRRWLQFSLRGLLMLLLVALTALGYYADQIHRQQIACAAIRKLGGQCLIGTADNSSERLNRLKTRLAGWLGDDAVYAVRDVHLGGCSLRDDDLASLSGLPNVRLLILTSTPITDAGLEHIRPLKRLRILDLRFTHVTPEAVERLRRDLPNAQIVYRSDLD